MKTEIVRVVAADGVALSGACFEGVGEPPGNVDAVLFLHGDGSNFYAPLYLGLASHLATAGITCLLGNRRGHDLVAYGTKDGPLAGYAFESVADSKADFRSWLDFLRARNCRRVALGGHSGGAVRSVYAQAMQGYGETAAVIAVSPGEYHHESVVALHGEDFAGAFRTAEENVRDGSPNELSLPGVPWGSIWSAAAFVDCFNQDNRYSVSHHAANTHCPTLFVFGAAECEGEQTLPVCALACSRLLQADLSHVDVRVIAGANHSYEGEESVLYETITRWLGTV